MPRMIRVTYAAMAILTAAMPLAAAAASDQPSHVVIDENCVVTRFYGVPLDLKLADLDALKIDHTRGFVSGEGDYYPAATLVVGNNILLQADFGTDEKPDLYMLKTRSPGAIGPRGVAIGASLKDVRAKWPEGSFYWASAHGNYVAFETGTNVYFEFDPADMPPKAFDLPPPLKQTASGEWVAEPVEKVEPDPEKLKVIGIRIASSANDYSCPQPARKTK